MLFFIFIIIVLYINIAVELLIMTCEKIMMQKFKLKNPKSRVIIPKIIAKHVSKCRDYKSKGIKNQYPKLNTQLTSSSTKNQEKPKVAHSFIRLWKVMTFRNTNNYDISKLDLGSDFLFQQIAVILWGSNFFLREVWTSIQGKFCVLCDYVMVHFHQSLPVNLQQTSNIKI